MKTENTEINSFVCKCGNISCRKIHIHSFKNHIPENDSFEYSFLHHKSLHVHNSKSIIVDKCCGNCLLFHCSKCMEHFSIRKIQISKLKYIIGFDSNCLTFLEPARCNRIAIIPEFPIVLRPFVYLSESKQCDNTICNENLHSLSNLTTKSFNYEDDDEILSFDSDEDIMFGSHQIELIIGKYNECCILNK